MFDEASLYPPIIAPTLTLVSGTSLTLTFPTTVTSVELGQKFRIPAFLAEQIGNITGKEEIIISVAGTNYPLVARPSGIYITSQMLVKAFKQPRGVFAPYYLIEFGVNGTTDVFFGLKGFYPRRTYLDVVTPPVDASTAVTTG